MSTRLKALQNLSGFFDHLSGRKQGDEELKPEASHMDPKEHADMGPAHEKSESPIDETDESFGSARDTDDGSNDGVMNSDPQSMDSKMPEHEKSHGDGIPHMPDNPTDKNGSMDVREIMRKAGRTGSGQKGMTKDVGYMGRGR
jgi:hypothetical protein